MAASENPTVATTPAKKYFVVSADCHVLEPPDLWERRIEPKFRHRLPRVEVDSKGNKVLTIEGGRPVRIRDFALEGEVWKRHTTCLLKLSGCAYAGGHRAVRLN